MVTQIRWRDRRRRPYLRRMPMNWHATLWRGLSDEARVAARKVGNVDLKLHTILLAARYIVLAVRSEREGKSEQGSKAT
jgi:hypothetical protein